MMLSVTESRSSIVDSYFAYFARRRHGLWLAYLGFYLSTFVESLANRLYADDPAPILAAIVASAVGSVLAALLNALWFGVIWMHIGSFILGAREPVASSLRVVGAAFLPAGLLALVSVPLMILSTSGATSSYYWMIAAIIVQVVSGIGALVWAIIGMRWLNRFTWRRSLVLFAFMPIVVIVFIAAVQGLRSLV